MSKSRISRCVTAFFISNLLVFCVLGRAGVDIGFVYYVWVGVFNVTILAQFWTHAADCFNLESGQRLFPAIVAAAALGSLVGPSLVAILFAAVGPWTLMLIATVLLATTLPLIRLSRHAVPPLARSQTDQSEQRVESPRGGFALVCRDRYLALLAALMVLLNCVNTTGEYLLTNLVLGLAADQVALDPTLAPGTFIASFYGTYYSLINVLALIVQILVVGRLFKFIGAHGALLVLPLIALIGYGLIIVVPVFSVLYVVKVLENSVDYSIMNTSRHTLFLPLTEPQKYQGKMAIDAFFYRLGDLLQAAIIFSGTHLFDFSFQEFALLNGCLAAVWLAIASRVGQDFANLTASPQARPLQRSWCHVRRVAREFEVVAVPASLRLKTAAFLLTACLATACLSGSATTDSAQGRRLHMQAQTVLDD